MTAPAPTRHRIPAPDIARGVMLLSIALANAVTVWALNRGFLPETTGAADVAADVIIAVVAEVRGLPMFSLLLGYGIGMVLMRESARGAPWPVARGILLRRHLWLWVIGAVHAVVLFWGDILMTYALLGTVAVLLGRARNRTLLWIAGVLAGLQLIGYAVMGLIVATMPGPAGPAGDVAPFAGGIFDGGGYLGEQLLPGIGITLASPLVAVFAAPQLLALILVGLAAARRRVLEDAPEHRRLLAWTAGIGLAAAVAAGVPAGLESAGDGGAAWSTVSSAAGFLAGPGIIAAIALACIPLHRRLGEGRGLPAAVRPLASLGRRSLSGYVAQSVLFTVIAMPWGLDLMPVDAGVAAWALLALGVWAATVAGAAALAAAGRQGPLETLLRRLIYGAGGRRAGAGGHGHPGGPGNPPGAAPPGAGPMPSA
ncbi:DUF418 domain-containing protein [Corynebacterium sp. 335C]